MNPGPAFFIAARSLLGRRRKSAGGMAGAILGIGISLVPLVLVLIVSDGMIQGITRRYMETKTYHIQVAAPDLLKAGKIAEGLQAIGSIRGVASAFMERDGSAVVVSAKASHAALLRAVDEGFFMDGGTAQYLKVIQGSAIPKGSHGMVVGSSLAASLHLNLGDSITVITPGAGAESPAEPSTKPSAESSAGSSAAAKGTDFSGYAPRLSFFTISGIVSAGYRDLDSLWAFISPEAGENILTYSSTFSFFGIKVTNPYSNSLGPIKEEVVKTLSQVYPDWFDSYLARTWPEIEKSLYLSFGTTKTLLLFIMGIALIVAAINLGSALSTFVAEHAMDIAVLRSMGAKDSLIRRIFVGAGFITGSLGTILGLLVGLLLAWNINAIIGGIERFANIIDSVIAFFMNQPSVPLRLLDPEYYLEKIPVTVDYRQILVIAALSIILSVIVSLIPAKKASTVSVQELIRKS
jgi:lipoprotein-releasing system permease protein